MKKGLFSRRAWMFILAAALCAPFVKAQSASTRIAQASWTNAGSSGAVVLGDVIPVGDGTGRSWVEVDPSGRPVRLGITLTEAALDGLPADVTPGVIWTNEFILRIPKDVDGIPFDHVGLNWNPRGHPPSEIYGPPHFDVHFYLISPEQRSKISARGDDLTVIQKAPPPGYMAPDYQYATGAEEPGMGGHWGDPESHEFHGMGFTATFIYGTYNGEIIFWEPMITRKFLASRPEFERRMPIPDKYTKPGYYPTGYSVRYDDARREIIIALEGLTERPAS